MSPAKIAIGPPKSCYAGASFYLMVYKQIGTSTNLTEKTWTRRSYYSAFWYYKHSQGYGQIQQRLVIQVMVLQNKASMAIQGKQLATLGHNIPACPTVNKCPTLLK